MMPDDTSKCDPRAGSVEIQQDKHLMELCYAAERGDVQSIKRMMMNYEIDTTRANYDERTALHVAAASGRVEAVKELIKAYTSVEDLAKDRYGKTAIDDALSFDHKECVDAINHWFNMPRNPRKIAGTNREITVMFENQSESSGAEDLPVESFFRRPSEK